MLNRTRIAVFVSGGGTNLQAIIDACTSGNIRSGEIVLVLSNKEGAYALERAAAAGIPTQTVTKKSFPSQKAYEDAVSEILQEYDIEMIVLAGFMSILSGEFTANWPDRIINVHPALIPSFCGKGMYGLKVHQAALEYGVKVTGATVHYVNEVPDGGKIIAQKAVSVLPGDTPETLQRRVMEEAEWIILPETVEIVARKIMDGKENG